MESSPRIPGELLADDEISDQAVADAYSDPSGLDQAFRRKLEIREKARQAAMAQTSKEAFQRAAKASTHQSRRWAAGQRVYVFRRGRPNNILHPRDRWCGPGVIVLVSQRGIYVAMRSRLWRCGPEQLRPAHPNEMLGAQMSQDPALAELLQKINSGVRTGILDVSSERPPQPSEEFARVARDDEGIPLRKSGPSIRFQESRKRHNQLTQNDFYPSMPRSTEDPIRKKFYDLVRELFK